jgi:hypothetical protein
MRDCDQSAMGLPPVTSVVYVTAKLNEGVWGISEMPLLPISEKSVSGLYILLSYRSNKKWQICIKT